MKYLAIWILLFASFSSGRIYEIYNKSNKEIECYKTISKEKQTNKDLIYEFYGIPEKYRRKQIVLGYYHIAAFYDYKISECISGR